MEKKFRFKIGDSVAHRSNRVLEMIVCDIVYKEEGNANGKRRLEGIKVQYPLLGEVKTEVYHSKLLIPFDIAQKSPQEIQQWIDDNR